MGAKSNTPIIAMTAHATLEEENRCLVEWMIIYQNHFILMCYLKTI
jgi:hypothetical protein